MAHEGNRTAHGYSEYLYGLHKCWGGRYGVDVFSDTSEHTGSWGKIVAKGATVLTTLTGNWTANPTNMEDGEVLYGDFTVIELASGAAYCYRDEDA